MCVGLQGGELVVVDPALKEAAAAAGALTVVATTHGEVCALHKPGGVGISFSQARPQDGSDASACGEGNCVRLHLCVACHCVSL